MRITIDIDTDEGISDFDRAVLQALTGEKKAPVAKKVPAAKKAPAAKPKPAEPEEAPKPAPEEAPGEAPAEADLDAAVARATELVADGKATLVKEALHAVGAKRVSELKGKSVGEFLEALSDD